MTLQICAPVSIFTSLSLLAEIYNMRPSKKGHKIFHHSPHSQDWKLSESKQPGKPFTQNLFVLLFWGHK